MDSHQKANSKSSRRDEPNSLEASIARSEFPDAIDDQTRMQIKLMVQSELEKSLATDGSSNREAGTLRNVQVRAWKWDGVPYSCKASVFLLLESDQIEISLCMRTCNRSDHAFIIVNTAQALSSTWDPR